MDFFVYGTVFNNKLLQHQANIVANEKMDIARSIQNLTQNFRR